MDAGIANPVLIEIVDHPEVVALKRASAAFRRTGVTFREAVRAMGQLAVAFRNFERTLGRVRQL